MNLEQVKKYVTGLLKLWIPNKKFIDKISENAEGNLVYNGITIYGDSKIIEELNGEIDTLKEEIESLKEQNDLLKKQIEKANEIIDAINRKVV